MFLRLQADHYVNNQRAVPNLPAKSLINRKEEHAGGKESGAESLRMTIPTRREAHSSLFQHHLPAIQHEPATLGLLKAGGEITAAAYAPPADKASHLPRFIHPYYPYP
ncbi:unnamed protein product [Pleuronectes platessa]|uniref:Uncharacterized protein n=1 Tax=Pleuronectes platessa TaxID=8262 RepID=A0A9N7TSL7_PLEPL|nr:unnamed protein product [Pleuronectes platessa]